MFKFKEHDKIIHQGEIGEVKGYINVKGVNFVAVLMPNNNENNLSLFYEEEITLIGNK